MRKHCVWVGVILIILISALAGMAQMQLAAAQTPGDDGDCDDIVLGQDPPGAGANGTLACSRSQHNYLTLIHTAQIVREVVAGRLLGNSSCAGYGSSEDNVGGEASQRERVCVEQAGLRFETPEEGRKQLLGDGTIAIAPAGAVSAAPAVRRWNVWTDTKYSWLESGSRDATPTDGPLWNVTAGFDYKVTDRILIGIVGSFEDSDLDTGGLLPATTHTQGWGGGAYAGVTLTDHLAANILVTGSAIGTDFDTSLLGANLNSDRLQASGGLTGYWYFGGVRWTPSVSLAWSKEWQDADAALGPEQSVETAVLTGGNQLGRTFALDNGMAIEPWLGYQLDWTFVNVIETDGLADVDNGETIDLRIQTGFNWTIAENMQLAVTGEIGGLILKDADTYSGEVNFAIQF